MRSILPHYHMNPVGFLIAGTAGRMVISVLLAVIVVGSGPVLAGSIKTLYGMDRNLVSREVTSLCRSFFMAGAELEEHLDEFSHVLNLSDRTQLRAAIRDIERLEILHREFEARAKALQEYLTKNRKRLKAEGLDHLLPLSDLTGNSFESFNVALADYIVTRKTFLSWTDDHYRDLMGAKEDAMATFNQLSVENDRVMEKEYDRYLERIEYVNRFMKQHPELASFVDNRKAS